METSLFLAKSKPWRLISSFEMLLNFINYQNYYKYQTRMSYCNDSNEINNISSDYLMLKLHFNSFVFNFFYLSLAKSTNCWQLYCIILLWRKIPVVLNTFTSRIPICGNNTYISVINDSADVWFRSRYDVELFSWS